MTVVQAKFQAEEKELHKFGHVFPPKSRTNAWKINYIEAEGWIFDVREMSATEEEESPLHAWERHSSKMNAPPLLERAQQRRMVSCPIVWGKEACI